MSGDMPLWLQILWGVGAVLIFFAFRPTISAAMEQTRNAENKDWAGVLWPIALVVLFVAFLITLVRS